MVRHARDATPDLHGVGWLFGGRHYRENRQAGIGLRWRGRCGRVIAALVQRGVAIGQRRSCWWQRGGATRKSRCGSWRGHQRRDNSSRGPRGANGYGRLAGGWIYRMDAQTSRPRNQRSDRWGCGVGHGETGGVTSRRDARRWFCCRGQDESGLGSGRIRCRWHRIRKEERFLPIIRRVLRRWTLPVCGPSVAEMDRSWRDSLRRLGDA